MVALITLKLICLVKFYILMRIPLITIKLNYLCPIYFIMITANHDQLNYLWLNNILYFIMIQPIAI